MTARSRALFVAVSAGTIAFVFAFAYPMVHEMAVLWYYPLEHRWAYEARPAGLAIDFYGRVLFAMIAWAAAFLVTLAIARRRAPSERILGLATAWAATAVLLVVLFYGWTLYFRVPTPSPIPTWYQPR
jgi:hypothetical protein